MRMLLYRVVSLTKAKNFRDWMDVEALQSVRAGKKGASVSPMKNRTTQKPTPLGKLFSHGSRASSLGDTYFVIAGMQIVPVLHMNMAAGRNQRGFDLAMSRFPGSWPIK
jgi:hypothetical protein